MLSIFNKSHPISTKDIAIVFSIILTPILFRIFSTLPNVEFYKFKFFTMGSMGFGSINYLGWVISMKMLIIVSLSLWYITCTHWWRHALLIPLFIECLKLVSVFNPNVGTIDEIEFLYGLPISFIIVIFIVYLSKKANYYSKYKEFNGIVNGEINDLLEKILSTKSIDMEMLRDEFEELKRKKANDKEVYRTALNAFKDKLIKYGVN